MIQKIPAWVNGDLQPMGKMEVHRKGLRHPAISIFINDGDQTLIQRRAASKYHTPGLWANACCTHPHWGESFKDCAARRLKEELGITEGHLVERDHIEYRADVGGGLIEHELVTMFTIEIKRSALSLVLNPDEVSETRWISIDALRSEVERAPDRFTPWLRIYLRDHAGQIFGEFA